MDTGSFRQFISDMGFLLQLTYGATQVYYQWSLQSNHYDALPFVRLIIAKIIMQNKWLENFYLIFICSTLF